MKSVLLTLLLIFPAILLAERRDEDAKDKNVIELIHEWNTLIKRGDVEPLTREWEGANALLLNFQVPEKPLIVAVRAEKFEIVSLILGLGADVNIRDASGLTSLHHAMRFKDTRILDLLIGSGADVYASSNSHTTVATMPSATPEAIKRLALHLKSVGDVRKFWDWNLAVLRTFHSPLGIESQLAKLRELAPE